MVIVSLHFSIAGMIGARTSTRAFLQMFEDIKIPVGGFMVGLGSGTWPGGNHLSLM